MDFDSDQSFGFSIREDYSSQTRADVIWRAFADAIGYEGPLPSGSALAQIVNEDSVPGFTPDDLYYHLRAVIDSAAGYEPGENRARLSEFLGALNTTLLARAIESEENITARKRTLRNVADSAQPSAVIDMIKAAAEAYQRALSPVLAGLLAKLARDADELPPTVRPSAERAFRDLSKDIVDFWSARSVDRASTGYESMFYDMAEEQRYAPMHAGSVAPEPERVLELAFESGATGSVVWSALAQIGDTHQGIRRIVDMIKRAPRGSHSASVVAQQFATPLRLSLLLREDPIDFEAIDALLVHLGNGAAVTLLDALTEAKLRSTRRNLLDRLAAIGPAVGPLVTDRLKKDERWYVKRNMLTLLREARCGVDDVPLEKYVSHADARVRREATRLLIQNPAHRDRAVALTLRDPDVEMLKIGLKAARVNLPDSLVPLLAKRAIEPHFPPEFRTSALQLLGRSHSLIALDTLLRYVVGGKTFLGKRKLANKSPEMLIALSGLARSWPNERRAEKMLKLARDSKDPDIVNAVSGGTFVTGRVDEKDIFDDD